MNIEKLINVALYYGLIALAFGWTVFEVRGSL